MIEKKDKNLKITHRKPILWLFLSSTFAMAAWLPFAPNPSAKAQSEDPGQNPDPTPVAEATATPTPCPTTAPVYVWISHAKVTSWTIQNGTVTPIIVSGKYKKSYKKDCENKEEEHTTGLTVTSDGSLTETKQEGELEVDYVYPKFNLQETAADPISGLQSSKVTVKECFASDGTPLPDCGCPDLDP